MSCTQTSLKRGCFMSQGLYLKANGELPCWDDVGEARILRKLDPAKLEAGEEEPIVGSPVFARISEAFARGEYPNPGLCERCAVKEAGLPVEHSSPDTLEVLHVEPSYLCHLSCPQCIPQKLRKSLKDPPYHLTPGMYEGFLNRLHADGIKRINLVIYEGRGDPLNSPHMERLIELTKEYYPEANTCITTHGSFPYKPWIAKSQLDILRFSVDGAFQENYAKYRIGGKLDLIFNFMRELKRDRAAGTRPYVEWKYILFEWNDGDEEIAEAGRLAREFGVRLRFTRTHTPGRSTRYITAADVDAMVRRLAPFASQDLTFQLKEDADFARVEAVRHDQVRALAQRAEAERANETACCKLIAQMLAVDRGLGEQVLEIPDFDALEVLMMAQAHRIALPQTASAMANLVSLTSRGRIIARLLQHYLDLDPDAPDRNHVEADIRLRAVLDHEADGDRIAADAAIAGLIELPSRDDTLTVLAPVLTLDHPGVVVGLANVMEGRGHLELAIMLYERYLVLANAPGDGDRVAAHVGLLRARQRMDIALQHSANGWHAHSDRLLAEAAYLLKTRLQAPPRLVESVKTAEPWQVEQLRDAALARADYEAAYHAERRLRLNA